MIQFAPENGLIPEGQYHCAGFESIRLVVRGGETGPLSVRSDEAELEITGQQGQYTVEKQDVTGSVLSSDTFTAAASGVRVLYDHPHWQDPARKGRVFSFGISNLFHSRVSFSTPWRRSPVAKGPVSIYNDTRNRKPPLLSQWRTRMEESG